MISRTRSAGMPITSAISSLVGSRPFSCNNWREMRMRRLIVSTM